MADRSVQQIEGNGTPFLIRRAEPESADASGQNAADHQQIGEFLITTNERPTVESAQGTESAATIGVDQPAPRRRICSICGQSGHNARNCTADGATDQGTRAARRPNKDALNLIAPTIIGTANFMVVSSFGAECGLTEFEAKIMTPSMQRTLERLPKEAAEKAAVVIDPLVLITCVLFWMRRISKIQDTKAKEKYAIKPAEQMRADGVSGTTFSVTPPAAQQQTNGHVAPPTNGAVNPMTTEMPPTYGAPSAIKESFASDNF